MTIKQTGGIFGRNPTFEDVTIEGTLTFDGAVDVTTDLTIDGVLTANGLVVDTNTLYVDATNNRTGVGTVTPDTQLHVRASSGDAEHRIEAAGSGNDTILSLKNLNTGAGAEGHIRFMDGTTTAGAISYLHNAGGVSDEMVFYTATSEAARFKSSGNLAFPSGQGIDFSATSGTGTSELLDDYEEGTWTPALLFDNTMVGAFTYTTQVGTYTKIGRLVTASFNLAWSAIPSGGSIMVLNLPFTAVNAANVRGFISDQGGITNTGTYAITSGDGLVVASYVPTQCAISTVKSGVNRPNDPLQQTALTAASGLLRGEIIFEVS